MSTRRHPGCIDSVYTDNMDNYEMYEGALRLRAGRTPRPARITLYKGARLFLTANKD